MVGTTANAQGGVSEADIVIEVEGLACPFCTFGIEKKLKALDEVDTLAIHLEEGKIELRLKADARLSRTQIAGAIREAGFEANRITFLNAKAEETDEERLP